MGIEIDLEWKAKGYMRKCPVTHFYLEIRDDIGYCIYETKFTCPHQGEGKIGGRLERFCKLHHTSFQDI